MPSFFSSLSNPFASKTPQAPTTPPQPRAPLGPGGLPKIMHGEIASVRGISEGHPVWLVALRNSDIQLVVKSDNTATSTMTELKPMMAEGVPVLDARGAPRMRDVSLNYAPMSRHNAAVISDVMGTVNTGAEAPPLADDELHSLRLFDGAVPPEFADYLQQALNRTQVFTKMKHNTGFSTLGHAGQKSLSTADREQFTGMITALRNNAAAWTSMGGVAVGDLFVGNNDRLVFGHNGDFGVVNPGNLIFQREANGTISRALGYDTLDPSAADSGFMYGRNIQLWTDQFGQYLKNVRNYGTMCERVIDSFNDRQIRPITEGRVLLTKADGKSLAAGMKKGSEALAKKISDKVRIHAKVPSGVMARALYLGWVR